MTENKKGKLFLIPTYLGENMAYEVLPTSVKEVTAKLTHFIAENEKTARRFIKQILPDKKQSELSFDWLNKHTSANEIPGFLNKCLSGENIGLLSEAGCPGIADPGAEVVAMAHQSNIQVVPLVGPSSIILTMMSSGLNGQNFAFNGYLPIDKHEKKQQIKKLERISSEIEQVQIFIETPYRNDKLFDLFLQVLHPQTLLCIGCDVSLESEFIKTKTIAEWQKNKPDLHKKPAIFIFQKKV
ncbi:SAM-dependent methyltransferase [Mesonia sp. K7]|uniref:SAM-dependent methyltransferase n=1 Tax=Mesonia sp. K7 TaxID=2218606 RepID=UPI000DA802D6|nr:SAM-dependent methyltransferase [Mesonia sp. K7]PZD79583.1 SAM-dependent methyltransferase [Mesonia sp. K7]